ncbi:hypothetical protein B0H34DRAFT_729149 [Crassisporium funariophilum]|nr:hypothetical protein B0H34DRAFT_729149 [Crassisporium funariophilum]
MSVRFQTTSRRCTWLETTHQRPAIAVTTRRRSCSLREPLLANVHPRDDTSTSGEWHCPKTALVYILGSTQYTYQVLSQQDGRYASRQCIDFLPSQRHSRPYLSSQQTLPTYHQRDSLPDSPYMANMTYQLPSQQEGYDTANSPYNGSTSY